jgi:ferredoxin-thioredoxin reductase catalytic subunit
MAVEFKILRKKGFIINPNDDIVNNIIHLLGKNGGRCPKEKEVSREGHVYCPCHEYITRDNCVCNLYVKEDEKS